MKKLLATTYLGLLMLGAFISMEQPCWAQASLPTPLHVLSNGDYTFSQWDATNPAGTYPSSMIFHYVSANQIAPFYTEGNLNYDCSYNKTSRPRINGKGVDGFSFLTTSSSQYNNCSSGNATNRFMGAAVLGLDLTNVTYATIQWTGGTVVAGDGTPTPREWKVRLQYRVGPTGSYTDFPGPVEYTSNITGHYQDIAPVEFPAACYNQSEVYVRWIYFESAANDGGSRPELRVDEIIVSTSSTLTPPTLNPDVTNNDVDHDIEITFTDNPTWRAAITAVKVQGTALSVADYSISAGVITLYPSAGNPLLITAGSKSIAVEATGYTVATVTQVINAGAPSATQSTATINTPLSLNSTRTVTATAYDQFYNPIENYNFYVDITITNNNNATNETYIVDGNLYTTTTQNVPLENLTGASGSVTFDITIPAIVDNNDGISVQVQLADGITNVGTPFSFVNQLPQMQLTGLDVNTFNFYKTTTNNLLYRTQVDVTNNSTTLTGAQFTLQGSYQAADIDGNGFKLWLSTDATLGGDVLLGSLASNATGSGEVLNFVGLSSLLNIGTYYLFLTADISAGATVGSTLQTATPSANDFSFSSGSIVGSSFQNGNLHLIINDPTLTEVIFPQFIQGLNGTNNSRVPFACRLTLSNLQPNTTYRYINQLVTGSDAPTTSGAGNVIFVYSDYTFTRATNTGFNTPGQYGEFITDGNGSYTGWFISEPTGNARFTPGNDLFMRIRLNDGLGGTTAVTYLTTSLSVHVINFGTNASNNEGTGAYGPSTISGKNFVFLYDNVAANGRPLAGTFIENDGTSGGTTYAPFYQTQVDGQEGRWGVIIPNVNSNGVKCIEYRILENGAVFYAETDADGIWNGNNTINPTQGLNALLLEPDATKLLNVTVYLEGPFDGTGMTTDLQQNGLIPLNQPFNTAPWNYAGTESVTSVPVNIVDWVLVELRDADMPENATPATKLPGWPKALFLRNDGQIVDLDGTSLPNIGNPTLTQNLFIVVRHRNHIDVMSNTGATLSANTYTFDFSTGIDQAYGGSAGYKQIGTNVYGMVSGDSDADGMILTSDFNTWSAQFGESNTFIPSDFDMDGSVLTSDFNVWSQNFGTSYPINAPQPSGEVLYRCMVPAKE